MIQDFKTKQAQLIVKDFKTKQAQLIVKYNSDLLPKSHLHKSKATRVYTLLNILQHKTKTLYR